MVFVRVRVRVVIHRFYFFLKEANDWCTGTQICHESHFCCGRQKIGVPGLNSVMNLLFFIVGGKRLVYRNSIISGCSLFSPCPRRHQNNGEKYSRQNTQEKPSLKNCDH